MKTQVRGQVRFELVPDWERRPAGEEHGHIDVADVACDSLDRVYLHTRKGDRVMVYDEDGNFLRQWGDGVFAMAHGITIRHDVVYCTDNVDSVVRVFDLDGNFKWMLGDPGSVSETGYALRPDLKARIHHNEFVERAAGPFNCCCNVAVAENGDIFVADGYGNARIHHFDRQGRVLNSWGEVGIGPGQFHLPHGIALDNDENIIVCDRENDRLQFFDRAGNLLQIWTDVLRPTDVTVDGDGLVYVSELWRPLEQGQGSFVHGYAERDLPGRVTVFHPDGTIAARWGDDSDNRTAPGNFIAPHGLAVDSKGSLYVAEVCGTFGGLLGRVAKEDCADHQVQKFRRVR
ncbi:MAG TPA: 6-bladed beta-propeller [Rhodothermales bacterium]|jgi:sugar lactone lactonase YvrE